jgi:8-oxo-dGTP pyrophosphatase MutT (NUDIX family)
LSEQHKKPPHPFTIAFDPKAFEAGLRGLARRAPFEFPRTAVPTHFKHSSVLVCFWRGAEDLHVLLTKRAASLRGHPGQMSFPGGQLEEGETWTEAALRETEEEVGLSRDRVEVLGRLDDAWSGAGHLIVPIVGWLDRPPALVANPSEVETIHTPNVSGFFADDAYSLESRHFEGTRYENPTLHWEEAEVYGLSADLLIETIQYALGFEAPHGPGRLRNLKSYLNKEGRLIEGA